MLRRASTIKPRICSVLVDGQPVRYEVIGKGEPVIMVHGLCGSTRWWSCNINELAQRYRLYLLDLPGFGAMNRAPGGFKLAETAHWLLKWMQGVGIQKAHFVGHSMGGHICLQLAALRPEMVERLVLVSPAVMLPTRPIASFIWPLLLSTRSLTLSFFMIVCYDTLRAGPITLLRALQDLMVAQHTSLDFQAITAPTLLIWGEHDAQVPAMIGPLLCQRLSDARLLIIKRAGHTCMAKQAKQFNAAVLAFLAGQVVGD
ncbi:alpha/beta fold hydrolase [Ktedonosporobacter rubrisoli]|nr:alpha/beta hydrolase [Ktedonosporobacter rubrisoli]